MLLLLAHASRQQPCEGHFELAVVLDLAADVADDAVIQLAVSSQRSTAILVGRVTNRSCRPYCGSGKGAEES